ncbi:hypothetical protein [Chryseobacterium jejuense]|uniref:Uncharacterized protein n=1 Tax=Chryseobacterium jejuense TaxID=445960 RepID=A0A2X2X5W7_CHRJE|nr:hypothetical protein [Chryseobacterium jejuense]SDJ49926.1 hypothetical protein SAMN05421542_3587 [Chryseobacterium jejuense]SQB45503.1 Uncharacterised protein [Chryseobacterium jejuense]
MKKDQLQDKYNEIFQDIKEEKMEWSFDDFLQQAENTTSEENTTPIIPLEENKKPSFPKWFWMAASVTLVFGIGFFLKNNSETGVQDKESIVKNEVLKQKSSFIEENNNHKDQVAVNHTDSISGTKKDSIFQDNHVAEKDVMDEILPKRGRLKKERKPRYADNSSFKNNKAKDSTGYENSYVIVNGKRIDNVEEAINVTKYSFQIFANNVSEKLAQPTVVEDDY